MIKHIALGIMSMFVIANAHSAIVTEPVEYKDKDTVLEGFITYDDSSKKPKPGVLLVPDWMGVSELTKKQAAKVAKLGYFVFATDIYGKGVRPKDAKEAGETSKQYFDDRALLRSRIKAAYDKFLTMKGVDHNKIAVMGYCFGGTTALELARSGVPLAATVSFHGILTNPTPADDKNIKGHVLVLHGADDPFVPAQQVDDFKKSMKDANIDLKFVAYPGAVHAFTNPNAGNDNSKGVAYNEKADKSSWEEFKKFLKQAFKGSKK